MSTNDLRPPRDYRLPVPPGSSTFDLVLGGIRVRVVDLPAKWDPFVTAQYAPFAETPSGTPQLTIRCRAGEGTILPLPPPDQMTVIEIVREPGRRFVIRSHWEDGWIDLGRGEGAVTITARAWDRFSMSIENFLRVAFQLQLIERQAFLLHAAAVLDGGRAFLFFGPSGAGKSTATAFSAPRQALSDDMVMIDVSGDRPEAWAVPFYMVYAPERRVRGAWPIAGAFRLRQAPDDRLGRPSPARAIATVSSSIPFVHELGVPHEGLTGLVARFVEKVPVYDLHFTRSARFWDLIGAL